MKGLFLNNNIANLNNSNFGSYQRSLNPLSSISFGCNTNPMMQFSGMSYFDNFFNNDFQSILLLFEMLIQNKIPLSRQKELFNKDFNTKTNLPALKNVYNPDLSNKLANIADKNAQQRDTVGYCYRGVKDTLNEAGHNKGEMTGGSAYQADKILSKHENFKEVGVSRNDLKNLPAGCVIVWQPSEGHEHGHIAVTLGNGQEASDHVQKLITNRPANFSVFVPTGIQKSA